MGRWLALELASTIRHDGDGGVTDDLDTLAGTRQWLASVAELLDEPARLAASTLAEEERERILELRRAVRALFAHAVRPGPASPADSGRLMPLDQATDHLNAAARHPVAPQLLWPPDDIPTTRLASLAPEPVTAPLARAAVAFLTGPERARLRACTAPRCVRYFVQSHGRQAWCKPSCGNRARVARHYRRQHGPTSAT
ncbi:ABATE domain-containing protein [Streptomyces sp. NPDC005438]|uniref:CGNR zinc finger domain-containing protein n=1 Tax=Streptomyces sp. NPDC005438 TaxID=3156880 RepID=UPI0033AB1D6D